MGRLRTAVLETGNRILAAVIGTDTGKAWVPASAVVHAAPASGMNATAGRGTTAGVHGHGLGTGLLLFVFVNLGELEAGTRIREGRHGGLQNFCLELVLATEAGEELDGEDWMTNVREIVS